MDHLILLRDDECEVRQLALSSLLGLSCRRLSDCEAEETFASSQFPRLEAWEEGLAPWPVDGHLLPSFLAHLCVAGS